MIILLPPVSPRSSTTFDPHYLHFQHQNAIATSTPPQPQPPFLKSHTISSAVLWLLFCKIRFFSKQISHASREHLGGPPMRYILLERSMWYVLSLQSDGIFLR